MLYINVYLVAQVYGGREEGNWYYPAGTPLAAIPVDSDYKPGKSYYLSDGIHIRDCHSCSGTGECEQEDEASGEVFRGRCCDCGLIPDDPTATWALIQKYQEFFKDTPRRYEDIRVSLEPDFAQPFPARRPHYE